MTLVIAFHASHYRDFQEFSFSEVQGHWHAAFPGLGRYSRFVALLGLVLED